MAGRVNVNGFAFGGLQIFCKGAWGTVCTSNFDDRDALVACRQLGFTTGFAEPLPSVRFRIAPDPVRLQSCVLNGLIRELKIVS